MEQQNKQVIVLGGAGYIGSHACRMLAEQGYTPIVVDNLSKGQRYLCRDYKFAGIDVLNTADLTAFFSECNPVAIMHFAALSEVGESFEKPELYLKNNAEGTKSVLTAMRDAGIQYLIFSSTAAVYGMNETGSFVETDVTKPISPYGESKLLAEQLIAAAPIKSLCFRYFNAAGAHETYAIGEMHTPETHLIPLVLQTALGYRPHITIFGDDYPTKDGTCVRDYIHVCDIAAAHVRGLVYLLEGGQSDIFNLGNGNGYSVKQIIDMCEHVTGKSLPVEHAPRRKGDPAILIASNDKVKNTLDWQPHYDLEQILKTAYRWHSSGEYEAFVKSV